MDIENLLKLLEDAGVKKEDLEKALKGLKPELKGKDLSEALGEVFGKFGSGFAKGASGIDPELIKPLLELFGPVAKEGLDKVLEGFLGKKENFTVRQPGPGPHKREYINLDGRGLVDHQAPDINLENTPTTKCDEKNGRLTVTFNFTIEYREEVIKRVEIAGYDGTGARIAVAESTSNDDEAIKKANDNEDTPKPLTMEVVVPCHFAVTGGGHLLFQFSVIDEDGNYVTDFIKISFTTHLLSNNEKCCKTFKLDKIREQLIERIKAQIKEEGISVDDIIEKLSMPKEDKIVNSGKATKPDENKKADADNVEKPDGEKKGDFVKAENLKDVKADDSSDSKKKLAEVLNALQTLDALRISLSD